MSQGALQGYEVACEQTVYEIKSCDMGWGRKVRRYAADGGQETQVVGQDQLEQDADPEPGHGYTGEGKDPRAMILPPILADGGKDAQRNAHRHSQDHGHGDQLKGGGEVLT